MALHGSQEFMNKSMCGVYTKYYCKWCSKNILQWITSFKVSNLDKTFCIQFDRVFLPLFIMTNLSG